MGQSIIRLGCAAFLILALGLLGGAPARGDDAAALFKSKCAICHAPDGSGSSATGKAMKVPDLRSDAVQKKSDADLESIIADGKNKMPAQKSNLSADQIKQLVSFIRGLAKKE